MLDRGEPAVKNVIPDLPRKDLFFSKCLFLFKMETEVFQRKTGLLLYHIIKNQCHSQHTATTALHVGFLKFVYQHHIRVKVHICVPNVAQLSSINIIPNNVCTNKTQRTHFIFITSLAKSTIF